MALRLSKFEKKHLKSNFNLKKSVDRSLTEINDSSPSRKVSFNDEKTPLDFDLLMSNVERSIMSDHQRGEKMYSSKDLLLKSNPGIFESINDITNPRDIYSFINRKPAKFHDDISVLHKSERNDQTQRPKLSRTSSMKDLRKAAGVNPVSRREGYHSHQELNSLSRIDRKDPSITALFINAPYLTLDDLKFLPDPYSMSRYKTLPGIENENSDPALLEPTPIQKRGENHDITHREPDKMNVLENSYKKRKFVCETNTSEITGKRMDRCFTEIHREGFETKNGVLTDASQNEAEHQHFDSNVVRGNRNQSRYRRRVVPFLKPISHIPSQYLELRVPRSLEKDVNINRDQYKLKQRSLLQLKVLDTYENQQSERTVEQEPPTYKYNIERFYPSENKQTVKDLARTKKQDGEGVKKISIDEFAIEAYDINPSEKFTFCDRHQTDEKFSAMLPRNKTSIDLNASRNSSQGIFKKNIRSSTGVERGNTVAQNQSELERALTIVKFDQPPIHTLDKQKSPSELEDIDRFSAVSTETLSLRPVSKTDGKEGRPPTRTSSHSQNCTREKKEVLRSRRLEVFGSDSSTKSDQNKNGDIANPLVKLDTRRLPSRKARKEELKVAQGLPMLDNGMPILSRSTKSELPALTFHFNTGEVTITKHAKDATNRSDGHSTYSFYPKRDIIKTGPHMTQRIKSVNSKFDSIDAMSLHSGYKVENTDPYMYLFAPEQIHCIEKSTLSARPNPQVKSNTIHEIYQDKKTRQDITDKLEEIQERGSSEARALKNDGDTFINRDFWMKQNEINPAPSFKVHTRQGDNHEHFVPQTNTSNEKYEMAPAVANNNDKAKTPGLPEKLEHETSQTDKEDSNCEANQTKGSFDEAVKHETEINVDNQIQNTKYKDDTNSPSSQKDNTLSVNDEVKVTQEEDISQQNTHDSPINQSDNTLSVNDEVKVTPEEDISQQNTHDSPINQSDNTLSVNDDVKVTPEEDISQQNTHEYPINHSDLTQTVENLDKTEKERVHSSDETTKTSDLNPNNDCRRRDVATSVTSLVESKSPKQTEEQWNSPNGNEDCSSDIVDNVFNTPTDLN